MIKKTILFIPAFIAILAGLTAFAPPSKHSSGAPAGYTGSPGDGQNCTSCHGGSAATVSGWITSDIPSAGYTAGNSYTITVTVSGSGGKGFEVSPQNSSGSLLGTLTAGSGQHLTGGGKYVTHSSPVNSNPTVWTFTWTAPAAGTGTVTFYGAFTITEPVTKLSTLVVNELATLSVLTTATPSTICQGQSSQLNAVASGGSGTYTYSWTSLPPGFTSNQQNPVVQPGGSTKYICQVSDGSQTASDSVDVTVNLPPAAFAGNDSTYCIYISEIQLSGHASNYSSLLWSTSGDGSFSSTNSLVSIYYPGATDKSSGSVNLTLTASALSPCPGNATSVKHILFDPCTGIHLQNDNSFSVILSPNPSTGIINLQLNGLKDPYFLITITDSRGITILKRSSEDSRDLRQVFDLSGLPKGLYLITVRTSESISTQRFLII